MMNSTRLLLVVVLALWVIGCGGGADVAGGSPNGGPNGTAGFGPGTDDPILNQPDAGTGSCISKTCAELGKNCGPVADGCGGILECGTCENGLPCGISSPNVCATNQELQDLCKPISKEQACADKQCGVEGDGCGGTYECGTCATGEGCGFEAPFQCAPIPTGSNDECPARIKTCADVGAQCGVIGNGCGGTIDCNAETGGCGDGTVCGLGGPQKCGAPTQCQPLDASVACVGKCGLVSDGCEGVIDCSKLFPCPTGEKCGGGGVPNQCGKADACKPLTQTAACGTNECGKVSNGCDGSFECGTCSTGETCRAGKCEPPACTKVSQATACAGKECGVVGDGCGGTYTCGSCGTNEQCGLRAAFQCDVKPPTQCVAKTKAEACAGKECGIAYDGCGTAAANTYTCGTCTAGEFCGVKQAFQCDAPTIPTCTPTATTCAQMNWACGKAVNNCGTVIDCAAEGRTCNSTQTCMGGITGPTQCVSDGTGSCPLCGAVSDCTGQPQQTRLSGRVITPGRTDGNTGNQVGVPNAFVYILRTNNTADLPAIGAGIPSGGTSCERCSDQELGPVLASAMTDASGNYTLEGNIPVGQEFLLVVKVGKFRRAERITLPATAACKTTNLTKTLPGNPTRLPRSMTDGLAVNIPKVAVSTGSIDAMECVFHKMGIATNQFSRPQLSGRIHLYRANGAWPDADSEECDDCSSSSCRSTYCGGSTTTARSNYLSAISDSSLFSSVAKLSAYDMVVFDCEGGGWDSGMDERDDHGAKVREYVNRGGRMFASHLSFSWLNGNGTQVYSAANAITTGLGPAATWSTSPDSSSDLGTGKISIGRTRASPRIQNFASWMVSENVTTSPDYEFDILEPRSQNTGLGTASEEFVYREDGNGRVQQFSFNTPYGAPATAACGRVAYSGFHVSIGNTGSAIFPDHCSGNLTDQEKVLLYMLFDLGACVGDEPSPPECTPRQCPTNGACGEIPDGCGKTLNCGCSAGSACVNGQCTPQQCVPTTCEKEGVICSSISDGCGKVLQCDCPACVPISKTQACSGVTCGKVSDGCSNVHDCGTCPPSCTPITKCPAGLNCGVVSDGCNGTVNCGSCTLPAVCGAGGTANVCSVPECTPLDCEDLGATCGMIGDGCGGSKTCGSCETGQVCGSTNAPNQCIGCNPRTCEDAGAQCGLIGDGCGGTVQCGSCPSGQICGATAPNQCGNGPGCTPRSCASAGAQCGLIGDGCGGQVDCGACPAGKVCGISTPFQCGDPPACEPATCESMGAECGAIGDGCGGLVQCGECEGDSVCGLAEPNKCSRIVVR